MARRSKAKEAVPRPSPSYKEALAWLYGTQRFGIKLGLENVRRLFDALKLGTPSRSGDLQIAEVVAAPSRSGDLRIADGAVGGSGTAAPWQPKIIHVAGTNGKGSVCAMIDSILRAQGYRTGLFTSPHLITFRERIRINGEMISEDDVARGLTCIRNLVKDWDPHPTFFEIATALALLNFRERETEFIVLETGMGGRLDATNATEPVVSVITPIDLDHQKWLGDSLTKIAAEKAGIIKPRIPVVSAIQSAQAKKVIRARARECGAPLQFVRRNYAGRISLIGPHQKQNAALAIAALRAGKIRIERNSIPRGLNSVIWPARFQRWDERTIIDGAHNPAGAHVLAQTWRETFGQTRAITILALLVDKDVVEICRALSPITACFLLPKIRTERAIEPEGLAKMLSPVCRAGAPPAGNRSGCPTICVAPSFAEAFALAREKAEPILITGSLHFAGEALAYLNGVSAAYEECAQ